MTHTWINADDVKFDERQRKEIKEKDLKDLAASFIRVGLIHAPVINSKTDVLIVGERRVRALALTKGYAIAYGDDTFEYPDIPCHLIERSDPNILFEIEFEENMRRVDLTPMEEAAALSKLHNIRLEENPAQTRKDTATEVAAIQGREPKWKEEMKVADAIIVEQFKDDPDVQKAAKVSLAKAARVAKKKMEIDLVRALSGTDKTPANKMFTIYQGDAIETMETFAEESFDILLFDPPYGIDAEKFGEQAMDLGHTYTDDPESAYQLVRAILIEGQRILKPDAHVLMFCAYERLLVWRSLYEELEYFVWPRPLIWSKGQQSHVPVPDYGPRYSYECILFAQRGRRKINQLVNDVFAFPPVRDKIHAAEKPSELLEALIDFVAKPGDRILDPCVGSGSIFVGGRDKEVYITGIELDPNMYAIAKERTK